MAKSITVAELLVSIGVDADDAVKASAKLDKGLAQVEKQGLKADKVMKTLGAGLVVFTALATAAAVGLFKLVDSVTKAGDEIGKGAGRAGFTTKAYQELGFAAERSGAKIEDLVRAAQNQARFLDDATRSSVTPFTEALAQVGLTVDDVNAEGTFEKRFGLIADALKSVRDPAKRVALSMKLVGEEAGPRLLNLLNEGSEGIDTLREKAQELGVVLDEDTIRASEAFQDSMTNIKSQLLGLRNTIGSNAIPAVDKMIGRLSKWIAANRDMIEQRMDDVLDKVFRAVDRLAPAAGKLAGFIVEVASGFADIADIAVDVSDGFRDVTDSLGAVGKAARIALNPVGELLDSLEKITNTRKVKRGATQDAALFQFTSLGGDIAAKAREFDAADAEVRRLQQGAGITDALFGNKDLENAIARRERLGQEKEALETGAREELGLLTQGPSLPSEDGGGRDFGAIARPKARAKGKAKKDPVTSVTTISDLLAAQGSGGFADLARATPEAKDIEPTVAVTIINVANTVAVNNTFPGLSPGDVVPKMAGSAMAALNSVLAQTGQQVAGNINR